MVTVNIKARKGLIAVFFIIFLASLQAIAQNEVAIGSATTKSNAILWLNGNGSQGLILPVVTNKSAVSNPDKGMIVYDDADNKVWYRNNNAWVEVGGGGGTSTSLNLQLQGNQLQLRDGTTTLSTVNIASGTQTNGAFMVFNGGSWQYATLSGDVNGANGALLVDGIKGKAIPALPSTTQVLVYDGAAWKFQALTSSDSQDLSLNTTTNSLSLTNDATPVDLTPYKQNLTLTGNNLGISGGNSVVLPASGVTSITAGTGLTGGTITTTGTINVDAGTTANKIVQLDGTGKLPAVDGSQLINLPVQVEIGDISEVVAGTGLTGGATTGIATLKVDIGTTANKIVQLDGTGKLPAVDGSQLTNLPAAVVADGSITGGTTGIGVKIAANTITDANILSLNAGKITTGTLPVAQVPNLDASKITTGIFTTAQIPNLDASKITSGIVTTTLGGTGLSLSGGSINPGQLLIGTSGAFAKANLSQGNGIIITNGPGTIALAVDAGTTANKIVQLDGTGKLPAVDGSQLTNLPVSGGDITDVLAGTGLTGGGSNGAVTITLANTAVTPASYGSATAIPQLTVDGQGRITNATTIAPADNSATNEIQNLSFTGTGTATTGESFPLNISSGTGVTIREGANVQIDQAANVITINSIAGSGTVTNVTGTAPINVATGTTTPVISLANTAVTPGPYGTTVTIPQITVDAQGRITGASNQTIPTANTTTSGLLSNTDWNTFNNKGNGTVTSVTGSGPISVATGTTTPAISIAQANTTTNGYLSNTDWNTFSSKGSGTVTSVTGSGPISVATGTTTPAISIAQANTTTNGYLSSADWNTFNSKGSGTVTAVSVATANGFGGTSSGGATPAITLSTSISGIVKGNGTAISAATPGTDFLAPNLAILPSTNTKITYDAKGLVTSGTTLAASDIPNIAETQVTNLVTDLAGKQPQLSGTGFVKATGTTISYDNSTYLTAYTETDPSVTAINGLVKSNGTALSAATAGTDYVAPNAAITGTTATKITYDAKGLVTSGTTLAAGDIPNIAESQVTNLVADLASKQTAFGSQIPNTFYSAPSGAPGVPIFRAIVAADIPTLNQSTTGNAATVTTNANLIGPVTSVGNTTAIADGAVSGGAGGIITDLTIDNNDIATAAAIDGTKVAPAFGAQNISTTGTLTTGTTGQFAVDATGNITTAGSVGIGTAAPLASLSVIGKAYVGGDGTTGYAGDTFAPTIDLAIDDNDTGLDVPADGQLAMYANDQEQMRIIVGGVGIGTTSPTASLDIAGTIKIADGTQGLNKVLTSDASGLASWQAGAAGIVTSPGNDNLLGGTSAGAALTTGSGNSIYGEQAGTLITSGNDNTVVGAFALENDNSTGRNTVMGYKTMQANLSGANNSIFGTESMWLNTSGSDNTVVGTSSMKANQTGSSNVVVGFDAFMENISGNFNSVLGYRAGKNNNTSGSNHTLIGAFAEVSVNGLTNASAIGSRAFVAQPNSLVLGSINGTNGATASTRVGIGTTMPDVALHVVGSIKMVDSNQGAGKVLTSDASGLASWQPAGAGGGWGTSGNAGITDANYIGPNTDVPFNIKINNIRAGRIDRPNQNAFYGYEAGRDNALAQGVTAFGNTALRSNTYGNFNTAFGKGALFTFSFNNGNTPFNSNSTAIGFESLYNTNPLAASNGLRNTAIGSISGYYNTTGNNNVFVGYGAGNGTLATERHITGSNSIYIGFNSGATSSGLTNATAIGYNALVSADNSMVFGEGVTKWGFGKPVAGANVFENSVNVAVLTNGGIWTNASDSTLKTNITNINYGLKEILNLRPVSYDIKTDSKHDIGFIAQEVKSILPEIVYGKEGEMSLSYGQITAVLTKAMQEQQEEIEQLKAQLKEKNDKVSILEGSVSSMKDELENIKRVLGMEAKLKTSGKD